MPTLTTQIYIDFELEDELIFVKLLFLIFKTQLS